MKSDYLEKRVLKEWIPTLSVVEDKIQRVIKDLLIRYNKRGKYNYRFTKLVSDKQKYLFPKDHEILKPFRYIKPKDVKVVLIGSHPPTLGNGTGLPFLSVPMVQALLPGFQKNHRATWFFPRGSGHPCETCEDGQSRFGR